MTSQQSGGLTPTRRTLVKGAAWSVPVVAMGQTARAQDAACSPNSCPPECLDWSLTADACRYSTTNNYYFGFCVYNNCDPGTVTPGTTYTLTVTNQTGAPFVDYATGGAAVITVTVPDVGGAPICTAPRWYIAPNNAAYIDLLLDGESIFGNQPADMIPAPQRTEGCEAGPDGTGAASAPEEPVDESLETDSAQDPAAESAVEPAQTEDAESTPPADDASASTQP